MYFLVFADNYHPTPKANSICLKHILDILRENGHKVRIINRVEGSISNSEEFVFSFSCPHTLRWRQCDTLLKRIRYVIHRIIEIQQWPKRDNLLVEKFKEVTFYIADLEDVDAILTICNPCESVEAGFWLKTKFPTKKLIIYNIDTVSDCSVSNFDRKYCFSLNKKAFNWEKKMFSQADLIIQFKSHQQHFMHERYKEYHSRMLFQDVPLLDLNKYCGCFNNQKGLIKLLYAGQFYRSLREPRILYELFGGLNIEYNYCVDIYTSLEYVKYIKETNVKEIRAYGYIEENELQNVIRSSQFMLSLGNKDSNMFPSKIVSYVSSGKPIIHVFQDDKDPVVEYLQYYPDRLLIDSRCDLESNRKRIIKYLSSVHKPIDKETLLNNYVESTPAFNANQILMFLSN